MHTCEGKSHTNCLVVLLPLSLPGFLPTPTPPPLLSKPHSTTGNQHHKHCCMPSLHRRRPQHRRPPWTHQPAHSLQTWPGWSRQPHQWPQSGRAPQCHQPQASLQMVQHVQPQQSRQPAGEGRVCNKELGGGRRSGGSEGVGGGGGKGCWEKRGGEPTQQMSLYCTLQHDMCMCACVCDTYMHCDNACHCDEVHGVHCIIPCSRCSSALPSCGRRIPPVPQCHPPPCCCGSAAAWPGAHDSRCPR